MRELGRSTAALTAHTKDGLHKLGLMLIRIKGKINTTDEKINEIDRKIDSNEEKFSKKLDDYVTAFKLKGYTITVLLSLLALMGEATWWVIQQHLSPILTTLSGH